MRPPPCVRRVQKGGAPALAPDALAMLSRAAAASAAGLGVADLGLPQRGRFRVARARQLAVYLLHTAFGGSLSQCSRVYARDRATVRHACAVIEGARDDPRVEAAVTRLSAALCDQRDMLLTLIDQFSQASTSPSQGPCVMTTKQKAKKPKARASAAPPDDHAPDRAMLHLLTALCEARAHGARNDLDGAGIVVFAPRKGVTVACSRAPVSAAEALVARGLAQWEDAACARDLRATPVGRAFLRRAEAPPQAEPFLAQHARLAMRALETGAAPVLLDDAESPLAWLARRKDKDGRPFLAPAQIEAGERFRRDATQAQILQRVTANWEAPMGSSQRGAVVADVAMDARRRLSRACEAVGPELAGLVTDVCAYLKRLETVESERGWPARSGKVVLKIALGRLAQHYGLGDVATGPRAHATRHWGAEDYRPRL